jgi:E1A/CREB-binding protein
MQHIVATMSDRAATEVKFNTLLEQFKCEVMTAVHPQFEELTEEEQTALTRIANFFCGLHALIHFAQTAEDCIAKFEGDEMAETERFKQDSGTYRLIRTASKAFAPGGDEKSGVYGHFIIYCKDFLKTHELRSLTIVPFRGARFNILFQNAGGVFFLHEQMKKFLIEYGAENRLTKGVLADLQNPDLLAGCKALGLIGCLVTSPLWCVIEDKEYTIIDMNNKYQELLFFFNTVTESENLHSFMRGDYLPFGETTRVHKGPVYKSLIQEHDFDCAVEALLSIIFPAFAKLSMRMFKDHLTG